MTLATLGRDAWRHWRRDRELLTILTGAFVFLPTFAWFVLITQPTIAPGTTNADAYAIMVQWLAQNAHWVALRIAIESFAAAAILALYLSREHHDVAGLLRQAAELWPRFAMTVVASWGLVMLGFFAFIVPGLYIYGRVALAGPVSIAEPKLGFAGAVTRSVTLTRGYGWQVFGYLGLTILAGTLAVEVIDGLGAGLQRAGAGNPVALALIAAVAAAAVSATTLARVLIELAIYRHLSAPRHRV